MFFSTRARNVSKLASVRNPFSCLFSGEYSFFETVFGYSEVSQFVVYSQLPTRVPMWEDPSFLVSLRSRKSGRDLYFIFVSVLFLGWFDGKPQGNPPSWGSIT